MVLPFTGKDIQVEEGYTEVANRLMEALARAHLTGLEHRIVWFLLRRTYGYHRKEDTISLSQWETGTDTTRGSVSQALQGLLTRNVIYRHRDGMSWAYGFNKYIELWDAGIFQARNVAGQSTSTLQRTSTPEENSTPEHTSSGTPQRTSASTPQRTGTSTPQRTHKIKVKETPKEKGKKEITPPTPRAARPPNPHYELAAALAEVCCMDMAANKGQMLREAKTLSECNPPATPELLRTHYGENRTTCWWWSHDWRGKKGEDPTPATVRATWGKWLYQAPVSGNGNQPGAPRKRDEVDVLREWREKGVDFGNIH